MKENTFAEMPFLEHLSELRIRLLHSAIGILISTIVAYTWVEKFFGILLYPIQTSTTKFELIGTGPSEVFLCKIKVALTVGFIIALPYIFYQFWLFIAPGLHEHEKKWATPFVFFSSLFFIAGTIFCFFLVLPITFDFFLNEYASVGIAPNIRIGEYLSFIVKLLLVFGSIFELPIISYFLAKFGILTSGWLKKNFRYSLVVIFIIAGILTPPDVVSQMLLALPLIVIYGLCILISQYVEKQKKVAVPEENIS